MNQTDHHKRKTFTEEYFEMLKEFDVDFDEKYIFKPIDFDYTVPDGTL
jgi:putative transposase